VDALLAITGDETAAGVELVPYEVKVTAWFVVWVR